MNRRSFLSALSGSLLAMPLAAEAQPVGKVWRIGYLATFPFPPQSAIRDALTKGLREHGYVEGRNLLKTAKALGLAIPPSLLQRADQVIE